jgi:hypothetical protein
MGRGLWFVAGAGAGVYAVLRGRRAAEVFTVDGFTDRIKGAQVGLRIFREEVGAGAAEKETELRERFAPVPHGRPELTAAVSTMRDDEEGRR